MAVCVAATWLLLRRTSTGRQLYAMGDNPEGARRVGINIGAMHYLAFGWLGLMAGIAGLMQAHYAQEIVPNALYGRELDVLAAVVLGGARLGGGRGTILGVFLGHHPGRDHPERPEPAGHLALRLQDDHRRHHPGRHHAVQRRRRPPDRLLASASRAEDRLMSTQLLRRTDRGGLSSLIDKDVLGLLALLLVVVVVFGVTAPGFLSASTFTSVAFQLPELGLLTPCHADADHLRRLQSRHHLHGQPVGSRHGLRASESRRGRCGRRLASSSASWRRSRRAHWSDG